MPKSKSSLKDLLYEVKRIEESREKLTENKIRKIYKSLMKDLNGFLSDEYVKYSDKDGRLYLSQLQEKSHYARFLQEITKRVDSISPELKKEMLSLINDTYEHCYKGMANAVKNASDTEQVAAMLSDSMVRPEVLKQAVNNNISKLTLPPILERNRQEVIYQIQQVLNIGLMNGDRYDTMAKNITERLDVSYGKATRIVRTESHRNIEAGLMDGAKNVSSAFEGSNLIYAAIWRTMGDERVRPQRRVKTKKGWKTTYSKNGANHIKMNGATVKVGEKFKLDTGVYAEHPSGSGVASQDCNCRCFLEYDLMTVEEFAKATEQTPEAVRAKYKIAEVTQKPKVVKEIPLTETENDVKIVMPKSLEKFDDYQKQWVEDNFSIPTKTKEMLQKNIKTVIDNNAYSMRIHSKDLQSIINGGFKNQLETKKSGGTLSAADRRTASYRLFNSDVLHMKPSEFEKYGYLGSYDFAVDAALSDAFQYGSTIVQFNKNRLKGRVTYTIDDSLGNALYNRVIGGKIDDECSISGIPKFDIGFAQDTFKYAKREDFYNPDKLAQDMGCRYWELQYHGELLIDDVESICFTGRDRPSAEVLEILKEKGIKAYKLTKGGKLSEL